MTGMSWLHPPADSARRGCDRSGLSCAQIIGSGVGAATRPLARESRTRQGARQRRSSDGQGSLAGVLLAEDLLLLVTDDASGRLSIPVAQADAALGGANLLELALLDKVGLSHEGGQGTPGRVMVREPSPAGDEILDAALAVVLARQGKKPSSVIGPLGKNLRRTLYQRLAGRGVLRAEQGRVLGVFPARRWPAQDTSHKTQVRQLVTRALAQQMAPDTPTAALIALVHALRCEHKIVDPGRNELSRRQLRARAEEIASGNWAPEADSKTIGEITAAVRAAVKAAASAG